jgi:hypothetical protein
LGLANIANRRLDAILPLGAISSITKQRLFLGSEDAPPLG